MVWSIIVLIFVCLFVCLDFLPLVSFISSYSYHLSDCLINAKATSHMAPSQEAQGLITRKMVLIIMMMMTMMMTVDSTIQIRIYLVDTTNQASYNWLLLIIWFIMMLLSSSTIRTLSLVVMMFVIVIIFSSVGKDVVALVVNLINLIYCFYCYCVEELMIV